MEARKRNGMRTAEDWKVEWYRDIARAGCMELVRRRIGMCRFEEEAKGICGRIVACELCGERMQYSQTLR